MSKNLEDCQNHLARKSSSEVTSFRPSNTSCVAKLLEHNLADRKPKNLFSPFQAGFCIVQAVEVGFQPCRMQCSVLALLDFSKAYDMVWREKLLLNMLDTGIPPTFMRWLRSFFNNHRACVLFLNVFSSSRRFTQRLPQGCVLAPLLFLFYINYLASLLKDNAVIALFADDVSILTTTRKKEDAQGAAQSVVNSMLN